MFLEAGTLDCYQDCVVYTLSMYYRGSLQISINVQCYHNSSTVCFPSFTPLTVHLPKAYYHPCEWVGKGFVCLSVCVSFQAITFEPLIYLPDDQGQVIRARSRSHVIIIQNFQWS